MFRRGGSGHHQRSNALAKLAGAGGRLEFAAGSGRGFCRGGAGGGGDVGSGVRALVGAGAGVRTGFRAGGQARGSLSGVVFLAQWVHKYALLARWCWWLPSPSADKAGAMGAGF